MLNVGKIIKSKYLLPGAVALGAGMAIHNAHPLKGMVNTALDMAYSTPEYDGTQADNEILGRDASFSDLFPGLTPQFMNPNISPIHRIRNALKSDAIGDMSMVNHMPGIMGRLADTTELELYGSTNTTQYTPPRRGSSDPSTAFALNVPYAPLVNRPGVSGDTVFGMYNSRQGG